MHTTGDVDQKKKFNFYASNYKSWFWRKAPWIILQKQI